MIPRVKKGGRSYVKAEKILAALEQNHELIMAQGAN
jgi:hypothetical protein